MSGNEKLERELESFLKENDSRVAVLYRKLPRPEPGAELDSTVLAMAHRAVPASMHPRRPRWLSAIGAAAMVVLAAGVAFRIGPQIWQSHTIAPAATHDESATKNVTKVHRQNEPLLAAPPPVSPVAEPAAALPAQAQADMVAKPEALPPRSEAAPMRAPSAGRHAAPTPPSQKVENAEPQPATPMAFPGRALRKPAMDSVGPRLAVPAKPQAMQANDASGAAAAPESPSPQTAEQVARPAAKTARAALRPYPLTAVRQWNRSWSTNEPQTREQWIAVIEHLLSEDRHDDAVQALAEFRERFPDDELPPDLRNLK